MSRKGTFSGRHQARRKALQVLYAWQVSGDALSNIVAHVLAEKDKRPFDEEYFHQIVHQVVDRVDAWDALMKPHLAYEALDPIELAILRIAIYELQDRIEIPYRVVINEALELAKSFGSIEGYKFVNGVLDKVAKDLRNKEVK